MMQFKTIKQNDIIKNCTKYNFAGYEVLIRVLEYNIRGEKAILAVNRYS